MNPTTPQPDLPATEGAAMARDTPAASAVAPGAPTPAARDMPATPAVPPAPIAHATVPMPRTRVTRKPAVAPASKPARVRVPGVKKAAGQPVVSSEPVPAAGSAAPVKAVKAMKPAKAVRPAREAEAVKDVRPVKPAKPDVAARSSAPATGPKARVKLKPVRDGFTMPRADFDLIDQMKARAVAFGRPAKKSELLRAGLHVLMALDDAALRRRLDELTPLKPGRPKKSEG